MNYSPNTLWIRRLIWTYFILLIFEGCLRKWFLTGLSNPLLVVRAPIVIAIYTLALQARLFPWNRWVVCCCLLAFLAVFAGLYALQSAPLVVLFGFQADFLHLPLIFLIPRVYDIQDVRRVGYWMLVFTIPMSLLMVGQFLASPSAWINAGAGGGTDSQIGAALGHIRPAGTFTFVSGPAAFFPFAAAFLLWSQMAKAGYPRWLLIAATLALILGTGVSSSRGLATAVGIVIVGAVVAGTVLQPSLISQRLIMRTVQGFVGLVIIGFAVSQLPVFTQGLETFQARINGTGDTANSFADRGISGFTTPWDLIATTPLLGNGLGMGTNAGSALITGGQARFLLAEGEWARVILESGPVLGVAYLVLRVALLGGMLWTSVRLAKQGSVLPFLLVASCAPILAGGQFGQPTELGFAVLESGLILAAMWLRPAPAAVLPDAPLVGQGAEQAA